LYLPWIFTYLVEIEEANHHVPFVFKGKISSSNYNLLWDTMDNIYASWSTHWFWYCYCALLWQPSSSPYNPTFHKRTKHIDIDYRMVRENLQDNFIHLLPIHSNEKVVDVFTKSLDHSAFKNIISKLGTMSIHCPVWRWVLWATIVHRL